MSSFEDFEDYQRRKVRRKLKYIIVLAVLALVVGFLKIPLGPYRIGYLEGFQVLFTHLTGGTVADHIDEYVIWELNTPRAIASLLTGAALGICGAAMQSTLKNPLADPYMTGIASGANLGISVAVVGGISVLPWVTGQAGFIGNAFLFSLVPALFITGVSVLRRNTSPAMMILIGVAVMYLFGACSTMLNLLASPDQYVYIYTWSLGTLGSVTWEFLPYILGAVIVGLILLSSLYARLNILAYDDRVATSLGINCRRLRLLSIITVSLVTAIVVCFTGTIGFVGLVAPHILRSRIGSDNRYLLPASAAAGAFMLAAADAIAVETTSVGVPVGVITSLIGGPLFIYLLIKQYKQIWS